MSWVPLRVHSQYSILDASASVSQLAQRAKQQGMPALALTDHANLHGAVEFFQACKKAEIKPIIGCELYVAPESRNLKQKVAGQRNSHSLVLLAKNQEGYHNLCELSSIGYLEGFYYVPRIDDEVLKKYSAGLICVTGAYGSRLGDFLLQGDQSQTDQLLQFYQSLFGEDLYLDLQRHPMSEQDLEEDGMYDESWLLQKYQSYIESQEAINRALLSLAKEKNLPVVATNDSHYLDREDWRAHEILLNVQSGEPCELWEKDSQGNLKFRVPNPKRNTYASHELYFKSPEQMQQIFADVPEAINSTLEVAEKCSLQLDFETKHYPVYIPESIQDKDYTEEQRRSAAEDFLKELCEQGIQRRYVGENIEKIAEKFPERDPMDVVRERLDREMGIIVSKGMCDYLLIVWDFIHWAKSQGIPVGPGRGSGAGSIILYLIGITDIEPLRFSLFFERFINPERLSYPDIDVDICMDRRAEVIQYTVDKYGASNVAQIITFGTMKAKSVIKDVGRVLSVPLPKVNAIAKLIPDDLNITLESALEKDADLLKFYKEDEEVHRVIDLGKKLEGCIRSTGIHAAGIIVCGEPLTQHIPLCVAKDSDMAVTQYSMKPVEQVGMLKIDFLGLKTLTSIQKTVEAVKERYDTDIDWMSLQLEDAATFELLNQGRTASVFQLESGGMQDLARQLHLDLFEEIIAVGALYRPGPMDMIPSFIARKHGKEPIEYDHPWVKDILNETYGIMVYQEQVMQIASTIANYSLGEGDVLRRAMGKKDMKQMAEQREKFRQGALENSIDESISMGIFDKMEKFAQYGFNKSHATAYGYLSYVTAFFKANYPGEWFAALMTCDRDDLTKVSKLIREAQSMGIQILPPDINEATTVFRATEKGIRFAMAGVRGVGGGVVETILQERAQGGKFKSFYDFFQRVDVKRIGKKTIEALVEAGSFDCMQWSRDAMRESVDVMFDTAVKEKADKASGYMSLFSVLEDGGSAARFAQPPSVKEPRTTIERLLKEKELLGVFLTGHPLEEAQPVLKRLSCVPLQKIEQLDHDSVVRCAFIVEGVNVRVSSKTQKKFAILVISDGITSYELPIWPELYEVYREILAENQLLYAVLQIDRPEDSLRLSCHWLGDLTRVNESMIEACDAAYDKAKEQVARFTMRRAAAENNKQKKGTKKKMSTQPVTQSEPKSVTIAIRLDDARLSHMLELQKILQEHNGATPVCIDFLAPHGTMATLHLEEETTVKPDPKLRERLEKLGWIDSVVYQ